MILTADQQPLLPQYREGDDEPQVLVETCELVDSRKERIAEVLESKTFHKVIISLVRTYNSSTTWMIPSRSR